MGLMGNWEDPQDNARHVVLSFHLIPVGSRCFTLLDHS